MNPVNFFWKMEEKLNWDYDEEAGVLYISIGEPQKVLEIDIGEGIYRPV